MQGEKIDESSGHLGIYEPSQPVFPDVVEVSSSLCDPVWRGQSKTLRPLSCVPTLSFIDLGLEEWVESENSEELENTEIGREKKSKSLVGREKVVMKNGSGWKES